MHKVNRGAYWMGMLLALCGTLAAAQTKQLPMPPHLSAEADPRTVLKDYPLGVIDRQAAFVHHGKAHHTVRLPNGQEGWVYAVGEERGLRTYTLAFDDKGVVTDVLYQEVGRHSGLTAVQAQRPPLEPGPRQKREDRQWGGR